MAQLVAGETTIEESKSVRTSVNVSIKEPVSVKVTFMTLSPNGSTENTS